MRGVPIMVGLLAAVVVAGLVVAVTLGGTAVGGILLIAIGAVAAWPALIFAWMTLMGILFARARENVAVRLEQELCRCSRNSERVVLAVLRFPAPHVTEFPLFGSIRGALAALRAHFRSYDYVLRAGFSTYIAILPGADDVDVIAVRERLLEAIRREHRWRIHVGISVHPEDGLTPEILIDHAERHCA